MAMLGHSVPGRPHLMIHRDPEDAEHEIWVDKYRGTESHNDPGWVIVCSREGCCCTYDMESELFDLAMCPRHSATAIDDQPEHPFGRRDGHVNKRCFLCADEDLERAPIFALFSLPLCMKCTEFTTRTYNFKNLAIGRVCVQAFLGKNLGLQIST